MEQSWGTPWLCTARRLHGQEGRVPWPCTHLSVLPLQWRRAAFPGQVSGTVGLGTALEPGTSAGGAVLQPSFY